MPDMDVNSEITISVGSNGVELISMKKLFLCFWREMVF